MSRAAPVRRHTLTAAGCAVVSVVLLLSLRALTGGDPDLGPVPEPGAAAWWAVLVVVALQAAAVVWSGQRPALVLPALPALALVVALTAPGAAFGLTAVAVLAAVFLAVLARPLRQLWPVLVASGVLLAAGQAISEARGASADVPAALTAAVAQSVTVIGVPLLLGSVVAAQRDVAEARRQEVRALRREQDALLQAAVSRQRVAMSRELHDIAAHHMSGIALMASAIDRQIEADPATAKRSARQIREQSRTVLEDLRRLVGLLREDADDALPMDALEAVSALVDSRRAAGMEIDLLLPPGRAQLGSGVGPLAQLVAYRMVQESLANALAHAPGARCAVEIVAPGGSDVTVVVRNGAPTSPDPGPGGGFGLVGMVERAELVGGRLHYGPTGDGGWEVRLALPAEDVIDMMRAPARPPEDSA